MFGAIFLNFLDDKTFTVNVKDGKNEIEIAIENGKTGLQVRLSKKQAAKLRTALENS